jgi:hypothetical protein
MAFEDYLSNSKDEILETLKEKNLIATNAVCTGTIKKPHGEKQMKWRAVNSRSNKKPQTSTRKQGRRKKQHDGANWRCNTCGTRRSVRNGSFFEFTRMPLIIVFKLIIHWVLETKYKGRKDFILNKI